MRSKAYYSHVARAWWHRNYGLIAVVLFVVISTLVLVIDSRVGGGP